MSALTEQRHRIRDVLRAALPDAVGVHAAPPDVPTPPCVTVLAGTLARLTGCLYDAGYTVEVLGPGGDNEAGAADLERLVSIAVPALVAALPSARITAQPPDPTALPDGQGVVLAQTLDLLVTTTL